MASFNKVILLGNLTRDPELRYTTKGTAMLDLNLAVNRKWRDESGQEKEEVSFIGCSSFGKQAETIAQYLRKGNPILIEGRLKQDTWEDKETGKKQSKTKVVIESFQFLPRGEQKSETTSAQPRATQPRPTSKSASKTEGADADPAEEEDVPF